MTSIDVVVGGQFGSEAKGTVAARLLDRSNTDRRMSIRVGGPNAGHTVYDHDGNRLPLRQVPVGVIFPDCLLGIAAGSEIDLQVLGDEIGMLESLGHQVRHRLVVDPAATILTPEHQALEGHLTGRIGSTGKGIGAARADRIWRTAVTVGQFIEDHDAPNGPFGGMMITPVDRLALSVADYLCLEGTQGYGLGLHTSYYPFCTSGDCRAVDVLAQVGINPWDPKVGWIEPWLVFRPYPIRVAGNSGPLLDETSWQELGLEPEFTTVTKKMRRVGRWDPQLALEAIRANGTEVSVALTMADQCEAVQLQEIISDLTGMGARVRMIGFGPELPQYDWHPAGVR